MKKLFPGYYRLTEAEFKTLWEEGIVALDTSVLLNIYRYPRSVREEFLKTFERIDKRLWLPHHVAIEFQANRLGVIADQLTKFTEVKKVIAEISKQLKADITNLQLSKRHSSINPDRFLNRIEEEFQKFTQQLNKLEEEQPDVYSEDHLRDRLDKLFDGKVGSPPESQEELDKLFDLGRKRFEHQRPPGYRDVGKGRGSKNDNQILVFNDLVYKREYGDLIIWFQLIENVAKSKAPGLIFVTDDEKPDWWWKVESGGSKVIGPRPELIEEFRSKTNQKLFYLYNSDRFLSYAQKYLGASVNQDSIDQVREITYQTNIDRLLSSSQNLQAFQVEQAVINWLKQPDNTVITSPDITIDAVTITSEGKKAAYIIKYFPSGATSSVRSYIKEVSRNAYTLSKSPNYSTVTIVLVTLNLDFVNQLTKAVENTPFATVTNLSAIVGIVKEDFSTADNTGLTFIPAYFSGLG